MSKINSIRGWIECEYKDVEKIKDVVNSFKSKHKEYSLEKEVADLYLSQWKFPEKEMNWTAYVFYGGDIKDSNFNFIEDVIKEISKTISDIKGMFYVDLEEPKLGGDDEYIQWEISENSITVTSRTNLT
jgi:hypothetical protein